MEGGGEWPGTCAHDERCPASGGLGTSCTDPDASLQQVDEVVSRSTVFVPHLNFNLDAVLRDRSTTSTNITRTDPEVEVRGVAATASIAEGNQGSKCGEKYRSQWRESVEGLCSLPRLFCIILGENCARWCIFWVVFTVHEPLSLNSKYMHNRQQKYVKMRSGLNNPKNHHANSYQLWR